MQQLRGTWFNQHGSTLALEVEGATLRGKFRVGGGSAAEGEVHDLVGFVDQELVAFVVDFGIHHCLTAWVGHLGRRDGSACLHTQWHMTVHLPGPAREEREWMGVWAGSDDFQREPPPGARNGTRPSHPLR